MKRYGVMQKNDRRRGFHPGRSESFPGDSCGRSSIFWADSLGIQAVNLSPQMRINVNPYVHGLPSIQQVTIVKAGNSHGGESGSKANAATIIGPNPSLDS